MKRPDWLFNGDHDALVAWIRFEKSPDAATAASLLEAIAEAGLSIPPDLAPWASKIVEVYRTAKGSKSKVRAAENAARKSWMASEIYQARVNGYWNLEEAIKEVQPLFPDWDTETMLRYWKADLKSNERDQEGLEEYKRRRKRISKYLQSIGVEDTPLTKGGWYTSP